MICPSNCQIWFTPNHLIICTIYPLPQNHQGRFTPQIAKYDLPQIVCTIYPLPPKSPGKIYPLKSPSMIYPPPQIIQFWAKFQTHNIMLCFTKVFSAKDQLDFSLCNTITFQGCILHWSSSVLMAQLKQSWQYWYSCIAESLGKTLIE